MVNKDELKVYDLKDNQGAGVSPQEKVQRLKEFKNAVFESYFA